MVSRTIVLALAALACLAVITFAKPLDDELETVFRSRRAAQGFMRGYSGFSRRGSPLVFVGGYAAHTRHVPRYAAPSNIEEQEVNPEDEPMEPMEDEEEPVEDEEEEEEEDEKVTTAAPVKPQRPARRRPQRPRQQEEDMPGNGGVTAIANSVSRGNGATSSSHAIAYGGNFSGGQFKHRN